ncbi:MAG: hypothetical protein HY327_00165 [Chloroflexi bacterium]|nr:hypothetical protein [Chloroflexota bacterium]
MNARLRPVKRYVRRQLDIFDYLRTIWATPTQRKYVFAWWHSLQPNYLLNARLPWLCFEAIDFLKHWLDSRDSIRVFEFGSGGSTLFWLRWQAALVSVEHDSAWFDLVSKYLKAAPPVDYRLIAPEFKGEAWAQSCDPADPRQYATADESLKNYTFRNYAKQIDPFPEQYFDVVLIDGRARPACLMHSASKVKPGGLLILDNAERLYYLAQTMPYLAQMSKKEFRGVCPVHINQSQTNIYARM